MTNKFKILCLKFFYHFAFLFVRPAVYTRHPFARYPYMYTPTQIAELMRLLLSVKCDGVAVEVGCNQGWTTCFLVEALREIGLNRTYVCIDTFTGFLAEDVSVEYRTRGKKPGTYESYFQINGKKWLDASMARAGYTNIKSFKADASTFDFAAFAPIAFALIDVDIYRPVKLSLQHIHPHMSKSGVIVVDDCSADGIWDGAYQAYMEFCSERGLAPEIVCGKLGLIRF